VLSLQAGSGAQSSRCAPVTPRSTGRNVAQARSRPDFTTKAGVVLDLYQRRFAGRTLGDDEHVLSADEKTSIQARCRCHPSLPPGVARAMRIEHEYERGGTLAYLAAWDVHQATLFGRCEPATGIAPFGRLVAQVMGSQPYASAKRGYWVVDNGSSDPGASIGEAPREPMAQRAPGPPANPRLLAQPDRDLLLGRATQGPDPQRLRRPRRGGPSAARLPASLPAARHAVRLALHPHRP
jgi:hypothetical protein